MLSMHPRQTFFLVSRKCSISFCRTTCFLSLWLTESDLSVQIVELAHSRYMTLNLTSLNVSLHSCWREFASNIMALLSWKLCKMLFEIAPNINKCPIHGWSRCYIPSLCTSVYLMKQPLLEWFLYKNCIKSILGKKALAGLLLPFLCLGTTLVASDT